jgi:hypothetical protein
MAEPLNAADLGQLTVQFLCHIYYLEVGGRGRPAFVETEKEAAASVRETAILDIEYAHTPK